MKDVLAQAQNVEVVAGLRLLDGVHEGGEPADVPRPQKLVEPLDQLDRERLGHTDAFDDRVRLHAQHHPC